MIFIFVAEITLKQLQTEDVKVNGKEITRGEHYPIQVLYH